jgi:hypothetical protein
MQFDSKTLVCKHKGHRVLTFLTLLASTTVERLSICLPVRLTALDKHNDACDGANESLTTKWAVYLCVYCQLTQMGLQMVGWNKNIYFIFLLCVELNTCVVEMTTQKKENAKGICWYR